MAASANLDFFAAETDQRAVLDFLFSSTDVRVFEIVLGVWCRVARVWLNRRVGHGVSARNGPNRQWLCGASSVVVAFGYERIDH